MDDKGASDLCDTMVTPVDHISPEPDVNPLSPITSQCSAEITLSPTATDNCSGKITGTTNDPLSYNEQGTYTVTWTYNDGNGNPTSQQQTVIVQDTTQPIIENLTVTPNILWPPNHKMVPVSIELTVSDNCDVSTFGRIISVNSNESVNGLGDGDTDPDWEITGDLTLNLRAERSGTGSGRVYTITVECTDAVGNKTIGTVTVTVPHDKDNKKGQK